MLNRKKRNIAEHVKRKMQVLRNSGLPVLLIAKKFGVTDQSVYRHTHTLPTIPVEDYPVVELGKKRGAKLDMQIHGTNALVSAFAQVIRALPDAVLVEKFMKAQGHEPPRT